MNVYMWCRYCDKIKSECKCSRPSIVLSDTDHLEAVKQARADALLLVLEHIGKTAPRHIDSRVYNIVDTERARLRALIEKEIEK